MSDLEQELTAAMEGRPMSGHDRRAHIALGTERLVHVSRAGEQIVLVFHRFAQPKPGVRSVILQSVVAANLDGSESDLKVSAWRVLSNSFAATPTAAAEPQDDRMKVGDRPPFHFAPGTGPAEVWRPIALGPVRP